MPNFTSSNANINFVLDGIFMVCKIHLRFLGSEDINEYKRADGLSRLFDDMQQTRFTSSDLVRYENVDGESGDLRVAMQGLSW
jgi:hypothetical protein